MKSRQEILTRSDASPAIGERCCVRAHGRGMRNLHAGAFQHISACMLVCWLDLLLSSAQEKIYMSFPASVLLVSESTVTVCKPITLSHSFISRCRFQVVMRNIHMNMNAFSQIITMWEARSTELPQ